MPYDERLARRLRLAIGDRQQVTEKKMFGGMIFMLRDHMLCGVGQPGFMFRVGKTIEAEALRRPGAAAMEFGDRQMRGFVWVDPARCDRRALRGWVALAEAYIATLPAKKCKNVHAPSSRRVAHDRRSARSPR
jgi:hypothetical protein